VVLSSTLDAPNPVGFNHQANYQEIYNSLSSNDSSAAENVTNARLLMMVTEVELLKLMSPAEGTSLFYKVLTINGLTSLLISFDRKAVLVEEVQFCRVLREV
jgi:hypothetical protein